MSDVTPPTRPEMTCDEVRDLSAGFVLGALAPDEAAAVRDHLATCPEPHAEIFELAGVLPVLDAAIPVVEPPAGLKARIMAAASADLEARGRGVAPPIVPAMATARAKATAPAEPIRFPTSADREVRVARRTTAAGTWALRIAAVLAIALLGGWNLLLQGQVGAAKSYEQSVAAVLDMAGQPGALTAVLTADGGNGPAGLAAISTDGAIKIAMRDLDPTTGSEVYEAWVIGGDGTPIPLGGFKVGDSGIAYFEGSGLPTDAGIVLALTREPAPGATAPSGPPVSLGTATAAG